MDLLLRIFLCITFLGLCLYFYIDKQNELTSLRLEIPVVQKALRVIEEENARLEYEIEHFESPVHLLQLARKPEFGHLTHPHLEDIVIIERDTDERR